MISNSNIRLSLQIALCLLIAQVFTTSESFAQSGTLKGRIIDTQTGEPIPFANIVAQAGTKMIGATSDFDGYYTIKPISPGTYDLKASYVGFKAIQISGVIVPPDKITMQDFKMKSTVEELDVVEIIEYTVPLISADQTSSGETVTKEDIKNMPTRGVTAIAGSVAGVFQNSDGGLNFRGQRDGANDIYIDGVRVRGSANLPQSAIDQVNVITGGLPAQYGDVTGGITSITTKGPTDVFFGSVEYLTSGVYIKDKSYGIDPYGYNLLGFSVSNPIFRIWDKTDSVKKPLMSFILTGELSSIKDNDPSAIGIWRLKEEVLNDIKENPLRTAPSGTGSFQNADFVTFKEAEIITSKGERRVYSDPLENIKIRPNAAMKRLSLQGKLDVRTGPNINLTFGGSYYLVNFRDDDFGNTMYNHQNNYQGSQTTWRVYGRFSQKFVDDKEKEAKSTIKNAYYSIHVGYEKFNTKTRDANHKENIFNYGHIGTFNTYTINSYGPGTDTVSGLSSIENPSNDPYLKVHNGFQDTLVAFTPSDFNPDAANYTSRYYELYDQTEDNYENTTQILNGGGLINGYRPGNLTGGNIYGNYAAPGRAYNGYSYSNNSQLRIVTSGSADIKNHAVSVGFEYEQRTERAFSVSPVPLWILMNQLANNHILQLDLRNPHYVHYTPFGTRYDLNYVSDDYDTVFADTIYYDRLYDGATQSLFNYNLRKKLGLNAAGLDWVDVNAIDPGTFSLDMFSPDELLSNGNAVGSGTSASGYVSYYGYDYTGKKLKSKPSFDDFFNKTRKVDGYNGQTVYERHIAPYEPIYVAGYIQDKFAFKDLIFNIGLRIDRFDANQKVLKDPYLWFDAVTAGEVRAKSDRAKLNDNVPSGIGDDYIVYVDDYTNPGKIVGYRNGNTWHNASGAELENAKTLVQGTGIQPYLIDPDKTTGDQISSTAFKDYKPQTIFMPRVAFSFPISDEALFFAHYDVLSRRPFDGIRLDPTDYMFVQNRNVVLNNPDLKPEKTYTFELGFNQKIDNFSALKISAFYNRIKDQIQITNVVEAFPTTYLTWGNLDFGTVKGMSASYDLRRLGNVRIRANYTLQFAQGTGSSSGFALNIINAGQPNLKTVNPYNYDRRHLINLSFDYRYGRGKDYNGPVWRNKRLLEDAGANLLMNAASGAPYSKLRGQTGALDGTLNGSRLPWTYTMDARFDKTFILKLGRGEAKKKIVELNAYLQILNLLNTKNIISVYGATGNPEDNGFLTDPQKQAEISSQNSEEAFRDQYSVAVNNPDNYGVPRQARIGVLINF